MESGDRHVSDRYVKGLESGNLALTDLFCLPLRGSAFGRLRSSRSDPFLGT